MNTLSLGPSQLSLNNISNCKFETVICHDYLLYVIYYFLYFETSARNFNFNSLNISITFCIHFDCRRNPGLNITYMYN